MNLTKKDYDLIIEVIDKTVSILFEEMNIDANNTKIKEVLALQEKVEKIKNSIYSIKSSRKKMKLKDMERLIEGII